MEDIDVVLDLHEQRGAEGFCLLADEILTLLHEGDGQGIPSHMFR